VLVKRATVLECVNTEFWIIYISLHRGDGSYISWQLLTEVVWLHVCYVIVTKLVCLFPELYTNVCQKYPV